jgi:hypothetical protein
MTKPLSMTFHESYGPLPTSLLRLYRRHNVSPADHDRILNAIGKSWSDDDIDWSFVLDFVLGHVENGSFRLPIYL